MSGLDFIMTNTHVVLQLIVKNDVNCLRVSPSTTPQFMYILTLTISATSLIFKLHH